MAEAKVNTETEMHWDRNGDLLINRTHVSVFVPKATQVQNLFGFMLKSKQNLCLNPLHILMLNNNIMSFHWSSLSTLPNSYHRATGAEPAETVGETHL